MTILVTGGAGFIGSNFVIEWFENNSEDLVNVDKLTYAGNLENLSDIENNKNYYFELCDLCDYKNLKRIVDKYEPRAIINFAAETHVDRSIDKPVNFLYTNIIGTFNLLEAFRLLISKKKDLEKKFKFLHISTDEIYGSLLENEKPFSEKNSISPNSPYSASKASSDHLVRAWFKTFKIPAITTNCSNNYGPFQFPEKLIPLVISNAISNQKIPIYGDGKNIRDWIYVKDHCKAICEILEKGKVGEIYNIGGNNQKTNLDVVTSICEILDELKPRKDNKSYKNQIQFVNDRPGHDRRYAINIDKISHEIGWKPLETFEMGIKKTICWYLNNQKWLDNVISGEYKNWVIKQYGSKL